jgi:hypothetical protein
VFVVIGAIGDVAIIVKVSPPSLSLCSERLGKGSLVISDNCKSCLKLDREATASRAALN